jgi:6-phosphofructokinase 2
MNHSIVTLTMNPAVDVCATINRVMPIHKLRCGLARHDAGGGGINVARVARRFGANPLAVFPAGGPIGTLLERLVSSEGVDHECVSIAGDTREDFTVDEGQTGAQFRFVLPGPTLSAEEQTACLAAVTVRLPSARFLVASGSLPDGMPHDFYGKVATAAAVAGTKFVLDSSGEALRAALGHDVYLIKPSLREFEDLVGEKLSDRNTQILAARNFIAARQCEYVALSLGEEGALFVGADIAIAASAPKVTSVSTVGAGDSFLGALVWALEQNWTARRALTLAVAAGSAALLSRGTDLCHPADCERLAAEVRIQEL